MKKTNDEHKNQRIIEKTLERLSTSQKVSKLAYVVLLMLYLLAAYVVSTVAISKESVALLGHELPIYAFAGVFSSLANICVILLSVYCGKWGYFSSLLVLMVQVPGMVFGLVTRHNVSAIPGMFSTLLTLIAITMVYFNNKKIDQFQTRLRDQAVTDMLTGLPNRFACSELVADLIKHGKPFAIVSIDINNFKGINDTMGFDIGNKVLIEISSRWKAIADTGISGTLDFIGRLGSDEFTLLIRDYHSNEDILKTIRQYESALGNRLTIDGCDFYITASFGYAEYPKDSKDFDSLLIYADAAMHEVKRLSSSERIIRFTPDLLKIEHTIEIERKIRAALDNDTIGFQLQPQFDMNHKLRGFEALARMKDEEGTTIPPGEFIPVAEKVGLIDKVDAMVFRKSAAFFGRLLKSTGSDVILSINVSVRHLMKSDFLHEVRNLMHSSGIPAGQLEIEITESIMIDSAEKALQCIEDLRDMGVKIAIDDFGTGYSSLSYLNSFPANLLKIDKSFIDKMNASDSSKQYVAAIISIGHIMGFDVISEGVEEPEQLETLRSIGCDYIQGFIWGRPLPQEEAEKLVKAAV